jgi:hypothetical protein
MDCGIRGLKEEERDEHEKYHCLRRLVPCGLVSFTLFCPCLDSAIIMKYVMALYLVLPAGLWGACTVPIAR